MKRKILSLFLFLFALQIILPVAVFADVGDSINFNPEVLIPGMKEDGSGNAATIKVDGGGNAVRGYISNFYKFAIGLTGILATIMFAVGGLIWLTSGGSAAQVGKAKQLILGSLTGLVLALSSYVILNTINPKIVELHWGKSIGALDEIGVGCAWVDRKCNNEYEKENPGSCGADPKAEPKKSGKWHCCCAKDIKPKTVAGAECIKKLGENAYLGSAIYEGSESVLMNAEVLCAKSYNCGGNENLRRAEKIKVKEGSFACCLCVKDSVDLSEDSCKNHHECDIKKERKEKEPRKWTCQNGVCERCKPPSTTNETYTCEKNYQCCSDNCSWGKCK